MLKTTKIKQKNKKKPTKCGQNTLEDLNHRNHRHQKH